MRHMLARHAGRLLAAGVLLAAAGCTAGSDQATSPAGDPAGTPGPTAATSPTGPGTAPQGSPPQPTSRESPAATASPTASDVRTITVRVVQGEVQGVERTVDVRQGERVRIEVTVDTADEVHVHGYDLFQQATPGTAVVVAFTADIPGAFEVELEGQGLILFELRVRP